MHCKAIADQWRKSSMNGEIFPANCDKNSFLFVKTVLPIFAYKSFSMNFPENLRYTKDHEWISLDGNDCYHRDH